ncbi:MAG TPA: hypothetical protein VKV06_11545 [Acidimicrobiales bacterium]|nr:hypothetical protein [Acidimicrobiales bacterium]
MINMVAIAGRLARPAETRILPSGSRVVGIDLTVPREQEPDETAPLAWTDPPAWASELDAGAEVVAVGRVRRRFFTAGGHTQSRTEVVVEQLVLATSRKRAGAALARVAARLEAAAEAAAEGVKS